MSYSKTIYPAVLVGIISAFLFNPTLTRAQSELPGMVRFDFITEKSIVLSEFTTTDSKVLVGVPGELNPEITESKDWVGNAAIVGEQQGMDGRYNHADYKVDQGMLKDKSGTIAFEAYKVHEPAKKASEFWIRYHSIAFKFPTKEDYNVYLLDESNNVNKFCTISAQDIDTEKFTSIKGVRVNSITGSQIFFYAPVKQKVPAATTKVLPGMSRETNPDIDPGDKIGNLATAGIVIDNHLDVDGRYNHNDYKVEQGVLKDKSGNMSFEAYRVYEPAKKATQFLCRYHGLFFRFPTREDYIVYALDGEMLSRIATIKAAEIDPDKYTKVKDVLTTTIVGSRIFFYAPSSQRVSIYAKFSDSMEAAKIKDTKMGSVSKYRYSVGKDPFDTRVAPYEENVRHYFLFKENEDRVGVLWQDVNTRTIYLTRFSQDLKSEKTVTMPNNGDLLIAGTDSPEGNFYYLTLKRAPGQKKANEMTMYKVNGQDQTFIKKALDPSAKGLDVYNMEVAMLDYNDNTLYMMCIRTMNGEVQHQLAATIAFDGKTLDISRFYHNTCSHSWDDDVLVSGQGEFVGVNLGDHYPRGIRLHKFKDSEDDAKVLNFARVVFSYKRAYYISLASIVETKDGFVIVFVGQPNPKANGSSLDNGEDKTAQTNLDPKSIGFIRVRKDFDKVPPMPSDSGYVIPDELILTKSTVENGGVFSLGGEWQPQRNTGAIWLTQYPDQRISSHIRATPTKDGNIMILWETQKDNKYDNTYCMKVDIHGKVLVPAFPLGPHVRVDRRDSFLNVNGKTILFTGDSIEQKLELTVLDF